MIATGCTIADLDRAAKATGVLLHPVRLQGKRLRFRLRLAGPSSTNPRWQRLTAQQPRGIYLLSGEAPKRKVGAVCWHGHRQFMRELLYTVPTAKLQTCVTRDKAFRWYTAENFEATHHLTVDGYNCPGWACTCGSDLQQAIEGRTHGA